MEEKTLIEELNKKIQDARDKSKKHGNPKINVWIDSLVGLTSENVKELKVEPNENVVFYIENKNNILKTGYSDNANAGRFVGVDGLINGLKALEIIEKRVDKEWDDLEKAVYFYDWLSYNCKHADRTTGKSVKHDYEFIITGEGKCFHFASAITQLLLRQGIEAYTISTMTHAFTIAKIHDKLYPVDADLTANDGLSVNGFARKGYYDMEGLHFGYLLQDNEQIEKNYLKDEYVWEITEKVMPEHNQKREELQNQLLNK